MIKITKDELKQIKKHKAYDLNVAQGQGASDAELINLGNGLFKIDAGEMTDIQEFKGSLKDCLDQIILAQRSTDKRRLNDDTLNTNTWEIQDL